jgi:tRNA-Thr(GGU) m(6)t(6)A37 methyltransferase TsaA
MIDEPMRYALNVIGTVTSPLTDLASAPLQGDEGGGSGWLVFKPEISDGLRSLKAGDEIIVLTWLDRARRDVLTVHPRGDIARAPEGVFSTRSPHRPNPIGLHRVKIVAIDGRRVEVFPLEALDGTPILDVKPILGEDVSER